MTQPSLSWTLTCPDKFNQAWWVRWEPRIPMTTANMGSRSDWTGRVSKRWPQLASTPIKFTTQTASASPATWLNITKRGNRKWPRRRQPRPIQRMSRLRTQNLRTLAQASPRMRSHRRTRRRLSPKPSRAHQQVSPRLRSGRKTSSSQSLRKSNASSESLCLIKK